MTEQTAAAVELAAARAEYLEVRAEYLAAVARGHGGVVTESHVGTLLGEAAERLQAAEWAADEAGLGHLLS